MNSREKEIAALREKAQYEQYESPNNPTNWEDFHRGKKEAAKKALEIIDSMAEELEATNNLYQGALSLLTAKEKKLEIATKGLKDLASTIPTETKNPYAHHIVRMTKHAENILKQLNQESL